MTKTRSHLIFALFSLISTFAEAMSPALPGEIRCGSDHVVVGTVRSAKMSTARPCSGPFCQGFQFDPAGEISIAVDEVLIDKKGSDLGLAPGQALLLDLTDYGFNSREINSDNISSRLQGKQFLFSLFRYPGELAQTSQDAASNAKFKDPFHATMWPIEERERVIYIFSDIDVQVSSDSAQSKKAICVGRWQAPCLTDKANRSIEEIYAALTVPDASDFTRTCYANALASRGDAALPTLIKILDSDDRRIQESVISGLGRFGPTASPVLPSLLRLLDTGKFPPSSDILALIESFGESGKAAIPTLINLSRSDRKDTQIIYALARLSQYDPDKVIPYLVMMLRGDINRSAVTNALRMAGPAAKAALPEIMAQVEIEISKKDSEQLGNLILAMSAIEDHEQAVPVLAKMLNSPATAEPAAQALLFMGSQARAAMPILLRFLDDKTAPPLAKDYIAVALVHLGNTSRTVTDWFLTSLSENEFSIGAIQLSAISPLPASYAEVLNRALMKSPGNWQICKAIANTHTKVGLGCPVRP